VYWDPAEIATTPREGEEEDQSPNAMISSQTHPPPDPITPATAPQTPRTIPKSKIPVLPTSPALETVAKRVRKPSQWVLNIINATGTVPKGIQLAKVPPPNC